MLLEFAVSNFRSIREEQTLSLIASNYEKELPQNLLEPKLAGMSKAKVLKSCAIYGPNASGKSNVLLAFESFRSLVINSAAWTGPSDPLPVVPFLLGPERERPTAFRAAFAHLGVRYDFSCEVTVDKVVSEKLVAYPKGTAQHWYERIQGDAGEGWKSSPSFDLPDDLQSRTRRNALFLSVAAQFNHRQCLPVFEWFEAGTAYMNLGGEQAADPIRTLLHIDRHSEDLAAVDEWIRRADLGVMRAKISQSGVGPESLQTSRSTYPLPAARPSTNFVRRNNISSLPEVVKLELLHSGSGGPTAISMHDESTGTQRLFALAGPWFDALKRGTSLFVDEIETSLHPVLLRELIALFNSEKNTSCAQLVFATHNPLLLDSTLMRRDQIWFTEKNAEGATQLYPLTDFKPRKGEALAKGYLAGRYGAVPFIPNGLLP